MKILIIGGGGREHALAWKLKQSPFVERVFCAPGNAGTSQIAENVAIGPSDLAALVRFAKQNGIDLTVVGPDEPLALGIADLFAAQGLKIFGPGKAAARLESSKIFAKETMRRTGIPTAASQAFSHSQDAISYCEEVQFPVVIKADGLALGKGVVIAQDQAAAVATIEAMMNQRRFGDAGSRVIIEEFLRGSECSLHALVNGTDYCLLATARDHKRAFDGNVGPNTGGMGAVSPADNWNSAIHAQLDRSIMAPLLSGLRDEGINFKGLLFPGLMIDGTVPRVLEFNCRFGDPETQAILPRMKSDLLPFLDAVAGGKLGDCDVQWDDRTAVTVVLSSAGYPGKYETGKWISGLDEAEKLPNVQIFHAGTRRVNNEIVTAGGRVLAITALGNSRQSARKLAYEAASRIEFEGCHFRRDIAL